jgi:hypothetical protein
MTILILLAAAAATQSAVPADMTQICIPFVREGVGLDDTRAKVAALGLRLFKSEPDGTGFTDRYVNKRYEIQVGVSKGGRRFCGAFDVKANFAPMRAAAARIVAQYPALKVDEKFSSFEVWSSKYFRFSVLETNDYSEIERISPGMVIEQQTTDWIPGGYAPG